VYGNRWIKTEISSEMKRVCNNADINYYQWRLFEKGPQVAHVLSVNVKSEIDLELFWEIITNNVAVYLQCEIDDAFERSNFYLCFFVDGKVNNSLIEKVENDQYSSKKYVFPYSEKMSQEIKLEKMASKMFVFAYKSETLGEIRRIKKVSIKNFRSYCGIKEFDLRDKNGNGAQLVVIFAPNGYGKTSFFDAIEWNLTGKIDRLEKIKNNNSKFKGYVLANTDMDKKQDSFVEIMIDNGDKIKKQVKKIEGRRKQDYDNNDLDKESMNGEEYVDFSNWNDLILPHHKIDNFVGSLTPEKRYKEWGGFWDTSGKNIEKFESAYKIYSLKEENVMNLEKELEEKKSNFKKLEDEKEYINDFLRKLKEYNSILGVRVIDVSGIPTINVKGYQKLVDKIARYEAEYKEEYIKNEEINLYIDNNINKDLGELIAQKNVLGCIEKKYQQLDSLANNYLKKVELEKRLRETNDKKDDRSKYLEHLKNIVGLGKNWFTKAKKYIGSNKQLHDLKILQGEQQEQLLIYGKDILGKNNKIQQLLTEINEERDYKELSSNIKEITTYNGQIKSYKLELDKLNFNIEHLINANYNEKNLIERAKELKIFSFQILLEKIESYKGFVNSEDAVYLGNNLFNICENIDNYDLKKEKWNEINQVITIEEKMDKELKDIILRCRQLISNQKLKYCPVCKTQFTNHEELLNASIKNKKGKIEELYKQAKKNEEELDKLKEETKILIKNFNEETDKYIIEKVNELINNEKLLAEDKNKEKKIKQEIYELNDKCKRITEEDVQKNRLIHYSYESLEEWYRSWTLCKQNEILDEENKKKSTEEIHKKISNSLYTIENMVKEFEISIKETVKDQSFILNCNIYRNYLEKEYSSIENDYKNENEENLERKEYIDYVEEELKKYQDIDKQKDYIKEKEDIKLLREAQRKNISTLINEINKKLGALPNDNILVKDIKNKVNAKQKRLKEILDFIGGLKYNKEITTHFDNYNEVKCELETLKNKYKQAVTKSTECKENYNQIKRQLEDGFRQFFNEFNVSDIYEKIEPHKELNKIECHFETENDKPMLKIEVIDRQGNSYIPEWYFSTAQLNVIAFSLFLGRALFIQKSVLKSVFIDDPIGHFDDMNILAFVDLIRNLVTNTDRQFIISTHEERVYNLIKRKMPESLYSASYIDLRQ